MRWWHVEPVVALERELFGGTAWSAETFWSELARPDSRHYVVVTNAHGADADATAGPAGLGVTDSAATVFGYAGLMISPDGQGDIQTVAVAPSGQGHGLGRRLLTTLVERAEVLGVTSLMLEVRADNDAAIALYSSTGFERIAIRRAYYQPGGIDAWVMRLRPVRVMTSETTGEAR